MSEEFVLLVRDVIQEICQDTQNKSSCELFKQRYSAAALEHLISKVYKRNILSDAVIKSIASSVYSYIEKRTR